jgi:histidinol dehydrogenase
VNATLSLRRLDSTAAGFDADLAALIAFEANQDPSIDAAVAQIVADVRARGDAALLEYTRRFDRLDMPTVTALEITAADMQAAYASLPPPNATRSALPRRASAGTTSCRKGRDWSFTEADGTELGQRVTPLDRVGVYVPGGKAAYPSSVLMNVIPAHVAGVSEIVMVVPTPDGVRNPLVLAAAHLAGVTRAFTIGGAQAVAALAYGTETIPAVDKICGPGNAYVAAAKRRVFGAVGIDMVAGVSEILIIADATANPDWIALDLFAQAEHDEMAQALLVTPDAEMVRRVAESAQRLFADMPRARIIAESFARRGALIERATWMRPARSPIASRRNTWNSRWPIRTRCCPTFAMPAQYSSATTRPKCWATIAPVPITSSPRDARRVSVRRFRCTISRSVRACSVSRGKRRRNSGRSRRRWRMAKD